MRFLSSGLGFRKGIPGSPGGSWCFRELTLVPEESRVSIGEGEVPNSRVTSSRTSKDIECSETTTVSVGNLSNVPGRDERVVPRVRGKVGFRQDKR